MSSSIATTPSKANPNAIIKLWKAPVLDAVETAMLPAHVAQKQLKEQVTEDIRKVDSRVEELSSRLVELKDRQNRLEEAQLSQKQEGALSQQQLEHLTVELERDKGSLIEHTEQLRYLAARSRAADRGYNVTSGKPIQGGLQGLLLSCALYMYVPFLYLLRGLYILTSPIVNTYRSLSLFAKEGSMDESDEEFPPLMVDLSRRNASTKKAELGNLLRSLSATAEKEAQKKSFKSFFASIGKHSAPPTNDSVASVGPIETTPQRAGSHAASDPGRCASSARDAELLLLLQQTSVDLPAKK